MSIVVRYYLKKQMEQAEVDRRADTSLTLAIRGNSHSLLIQWPMMMFMCLRLLIQDLEQSVSSLCRRKGWVAEGDIVSLVTPFHPRHSSVCLSVCLSMLTILRLTFDISVNPIQSSLIHYTHRQTCCSKQQQVNIFSVEHCLWKGLRVISTLFCVIQYNERIHSVRPKINQFSKNFLFESLFRYLVVCTVL